MAEAWTKTCTTCNKEFGYGEWKCSRQPGNHTLEPKTYFHPGGADVQDIRDRLKFGPHMILRPGVELIDNQGKTVRTPGLEVKFENGKLRDVVDPEVQYYLDNKAGLCDAARWEKIYLTLERRQNLAEERLAESERKIEESNTLLDNLKKQKKAVVA